MIAITQNSLRTTSHCIRVLKKTRQHIDEEIFALEAELAHQQGYIGVDATKAFFAESGVPLD